MTATTRGCTVKFWILVNFVVLTACFDTGSVRHQGEQEPPVETCEAWRWTDGGAEVATCSRSANAASETPWECRCGTSIAPDQTAASCEAAVADACEVKERDFEACHIEGWGSCFPTDDDSVWDCGCAGDSRLEPTHADGCTDAVAAHCGGDCGTGDDTCSATDTPGVYECYCSYYDTTRSSSGSSCGVALTTACEPEGGTRTCTGFQGFCDPANEPFRYECTCLDGTSGARTPEQLGEDDCSLALIEVCGANETGDSCTSVDGTVECNRTAPGEKTWVCTCTTDSGTTRRTAPASNCQSALEAASCH